MRELLQMFEIVRKYRKYLMLREGTDYLGDDFDPRDAAEAGLTKEDLELLRSLQ